jgi:hypothetical protein
MNDKNPLIELVKALARRRARLDAIPPRPANQNDTKPSDQSASK